jgi:hypothetical protein
MHQGHDPTSARRSWGRRTPAPRPPSQPRHGACSPATSLGAVAPGAARGALALGMTALVCAACSLAETPPTPAPLPPGLTGPILPPAYVPEPEAILASVLAGVATAVPTLRDSTTVVYDAAIRPDGAIVGTSGRTNATMEGRVVGGRMSGRIYGLLCHHAFTAERA